MVNSAACQTEEREEADGQVSAGPVQADRVEPSLAQRLRSLLDGGHALVPGGHRIVGVEATDVGDRLPEAVVRLVRLEVGIDDLGPPRGRRGGDTPVRRAGVHDPAGLRQVRQEVGTASVGGNPGERTWRLRAAERDARRVLVGEILQPVSHPLWDEAERLGVGEQETLALDPVIPVEHVDVAGAALVGGPRDLAGQLLLAEVARHSDELTRLDVGAEADDQIGEPACPVAVVAHSAGD